MVHCPEFDLVTPQQSSEGSKPRFFGRPYRSLITIYCLSYSGSHAMVRWPWIANRRQSERRQTQHQKELTEGSTEKTQFQVRYLDRDSKRIPPEQNSYTEPQYWRILLSGMLIPSSLVYVFSTFQRNALPPKRHRTYNMLHTPHSIFTVTSMRTSTPWRYRQ